MPQFRVTELIVEPAAMEPVQTSLPPPAAGPGTTLAGPLNVDGDGLHVNVISAAWLIDARPKNATSDKIFKLNLPKVKSSELHNTTRATYTGCASCSVLFESTDDSVERQDGCCKRCWGYVEYLSPSGTMKPGLLKHHKCKKNDEILHSSDERRWVGFTWY